MMRVQIDPCDLSVELPDGLDLASASHTLEEKFQLHERTAHHESLLYTVGIDLFPEVFFSKLYLGKRRDAVDMLREAAYHLVIKPPGGTTTAMALVRDDHGEAQDFECQHTHDGTFSCYRMIARGSCVFYVGATGALEAARGARKSLIGAVS
jgi:hypothetical protein